MLYFYKAKCDNIVDGDTIDVTIDLGFSILIKKRLRLYNIDTPENRTRNLLEKEAGLKVEKFLKNKIGDKTIYISSKKIGQDKYGRYLAEIYLNKDDDISLNQIMVNKGYAKDYQLEQKEGWSEQELKNIISKLGE
ncbi:MAG: thermonuclease family protein [archaeon]